MSKVSLGWLPPPEPTWDAVEGRGEEKLDCRVGMVHRNHKKSNLLSSGTMTRELRKPVATMSGRCKEEKPEFK